MLKETYTFWSSDAESKLHAVFYKPEKDVKVIATLMVAHGIGEYIERYEEFAEVLTSKGIVVVGYDCIGHGNSTSKTKVPMYFGEEGSWKYLVEDFLNYNHMITEYYSNVPCYVMGFSMGSFVVRCAMASNNLSANGAILLGTGRISHLVAKLVKYLVSKEAKNVEGDDNISDTVNELAFGNYNKYFTPTKTDFDWLCKDEKACESYIEDPLTRKYITPGMFRELLSGMEIASNPDTVKNAERIPILFVSGEEDPVGDFGKGVTKVEKMFKKFDFETEVKFYPDSRHDVLHDTHKDEAMKYICEWIVSLCKI